MWWLAAFVLFVVVEIGTVSLTSIWFGFGALVAFVTSFICDIIWIQILVFLLVSMLLMIFTKPVAEKYLNKDREKTNVDALVGRRGIVTVEIDNLSASGEVNLSGQIWMARTANDAVKIPKGTQVTVKEIKGVKLIVEE